MPVITVPDFTNSPWNNGVAREFPGGELQAYKWRQRTIQQHVKWPTARSRRARTRWEEWLVTFGLFEYDLRQLFCWDAVRTWQAWCRDAMGDSAHVAQVHVGELTKCAWKPLALEGLLPAFEAYGSRGGRSKTQLNSRVLELDAEVSRLRSTLLELISIRRDNEALRAEMKRLRGEVKERRVRETGIRQELKRLAAILDNSIVLKKSDRVESGAPVEPAKLSKNLSK